MDLDKRILDYGKQEVKNIKEQSKLAAKKESDEILNEAKLDYDKKINKVNKEVKEDIKTEERMLFFATKQAELLAKQSVLSEIFNDVKDKILLLEKEDLLNYVVNKIKNEEITGNEIMHTNKEEFNKYVKALSTSKPTNGLVELDLLNKILKTNLKLSTDYKDIAGGFILESKDFDLNFSINELIEKLKGKHERTIVKKLFE